MATHSARTFGDLLRRFRLAAGLTQEELAERANLSVRGISDLERGVKLAPHRSTIQLLVEALSLTDEDETALEAAIPHRRGPATVPRRDGPFLSPPFPPTSFIGRQQEVEDISILLGREDVRLLTLTGPGGVGKTRLALRVAERVLDAFPDDVVFVSLASLADPALVPGTIAGDLQIKEAGGQPIVERLIAHLKGKRLLLLLDNFEHLLPAAETLSRLLAACPELTILVTSRAVLHLAAEHEYPVSPLAVPIRGHLPDSDTLALYDSVQLFRQRAQAVKPGFEITDENAAAIAEICARLDGLPLAIELAAARIRLFSPQALLARLADRLQMLTGGPRDVPARQQTLRDTLDWSYSLLAPDEQRFLARLSVFVGGFSLEATEPVCNPEGMLDVLQETAALMDQSLLRPEEGDGLHLRMLETVREYALERLEAEGETDVVREQHAKYFLRLAEEAERAYAEGNQTGRDRASWTARLESEYGNLRAALAWSLEQENTEELAICLAGALAWFWIERFDLSEGRQWIERALALCDRSPPGATSARARAQALAGAATLAGWQGDHGASRVYAEQAVELWRALGDQPRLALALRSLGRMASHQGDHLLAASLLAEAAQRFRELGNIDETAKALTSLADVESRCGELSVAQTRLEEALGLCQQVGNTEEVLRLHCALAELAWIQDREDVARQHYSEATVLLPTPRDARERWWALYNLAWAAYHMGDYEEAAARYSECLVLAQAQPDLIDGPWRLAWTLNHLGDMARCQGDGTRAADFYEESLALFRRQGERHGIAAVLHNLGHVALAHEDPGRARALFVQSVSLFSELGFAWSIADCIAGLACVAAQEGQPDRAVRLFGAATATHAALDASGRFIEPANRLTWDHEIVRARCQLNDQEQFNRAWEEGRAMSLEEAVADAIGRAVSAAPPTRGTTYP